MIVGREHVEAAAGAIREQWSGRPRAGSILGTGLGDLADTVEVQCDALTYESIPHFPRATALGHRGRWICGTLAGVPVSWPWTAGCTATKATRPRKSRFRCA